MMAVSEMVKHAFPPHIQRLGEQDMDFGAVYDFEIDAGLIRAFVDDADEHSTYEVEVDFGNPLSISSTCACDRFVRDGHCRHLWAMLRYADGVIRRKPKLLLSLMKTAAGLGLIHAPAGEKKSREKPPEPKKPDWQRRIEKLQANPYYQPALLHPHLPQPLPADRTIYYRFEVFVGEYGQEHDAHVTVCTRKQLKNGQYDDPKQLGNSDWWTASPDPADRAIRKLLVARGHSAFGGTDPTSGKAIPLSVHAFDPILKQICDTGRALVQTKELYAATDETRPLTWDADEPYELCIESYFADNQVHFIARVRRGDTSFDVDTLEGPIKREYLLANQTRLIRLRSAMSFNVFNAIRDAFPISAPAETARDILDHLLATTILPEIVPPAGLLEPLDRPLTPVLSISKHPHSPNDLRATVQFAYGDLQFDSTLNARSKILQLDGQDRLLNRRVRDEAAALQQLTELQLREESLSYRLAPKRLNEVVCALTRAGWKVQAEGKLYRSARSIDIRIESGIDWFDVHGKADFDGQHVAFPQILEALRKGENSVTLGDGSVGLMPEDWLRKYAGFNAAGEIEGDVVRFKPTQVMLLDAMLSQLPAVDFDRQFGAAREQLTTFEKVEAIDPDDTFVGTLRPYQREGLGWLHYLGKFNFGGCLADDMGLGKTIQVLALLESRRRAKSGPSLVVAPRSLMFNWKAEAEKFTPYMRVLDHSDPNRVKGTDHFQHYDLILTTYGLLRTDAAIFKDFEFDYAILDEAQAIKNATTASAKAARLLRARHRLVMTGTPIENHLGELWSLFDFLNPGMFGTNSGFKLLAGAGDAKEDRAIIARTIRPFILRRTKKQVATDLPDRIEQTLFCELDPKQRKVYDQLRDHYRAALLKSVDTVGINKSQIVILEALLRLRQAACSPAIIDPKHANVPSAKIDTLLDQVTEAIDEGHKVLVFSQFTSMLALVREKLSAAGIVHEYLDGQTRDRQARVERFQSDPKCQVFLISLKAGGVGLNLTAADYVFLLDPWWNPAAEAQAIDRTHRIGQHRTVMAYRLIARNTVEEKVLELQRTKRELADSIIGDGEKLSGAVTREDLALLLS